LLLFPVFFIGMWLFVSVLLSVLSGWRSLARSYPALVPPEGQSFWFRTGSFGSTNYSSCLHFTSGRAGLFLSVFLLFRPAHPPVFVPWSDVSVVFRRGWLLRYADFQFSKQPHVRMRLTRSLGEKILAAGGNAVRPTEAG
jgi:hypothetical protein